MDKKKIEQNFFNYFILAVPTAGCIVTCILLIYFVGINKQYSFNVFLYCAMPLLVNLLISLPFKILKKRTEKND